MDRSMCISSNAGYNIFLQTLYPLPTTMGVEYPRNRAALYYSLQELPDLPLNDISCRKYTPKKFFGSFVQFFTGSFCSLTENY